MHEARFVAYLFCDPCQKRDNVMLGHRFDSVNCRNIDRWVGIPPCPQRLRRRSRHNAAFGECIRCMRLNFKPDAETVFRLPNLDHIGAGITWNHKKRFLLGSGVVVPLAGAPLGVKMRGKKEGRGFYAAPFLLKFLRV